tara:strand:- start:4898 stop:5290 length:393 start_codon:yes stop_codon:yes gene_type:complete
MPKQKKELTTQEIGSMGEHYIIADLTRQQVETFRPTCDVNNTDLIAFSNGSFKRIQIKTIGVYKSKTSVEVRMRKKDNQDHIDYVAIYLWHDKMIAYYPYNGEISINLALKRAKNNQGSRKWFYEYSEFI